jgi:hypothetical protein
MLPVRCGVSLTVTPPTLMWMCAVFRGLCCLSVVRWGWQWPHPPYCECVQCSAAWTVNCLSAFFAPRRTLSLEIHIITCCELFIRRVRKTAKSDFQLRHVCPSVHMVQIRSHLTDFREIWYLSIFKKLLRKIQVSLKLGRNNGHFT